MIHASTTKLTVRIRATGRHGFTLAEVIVAIAILAIIGVVIGSIFASVGDTVTNGRQVSNLNRFVARVERVMRRDFENMVRDNGFMVIRNEYSNQYNGQNPTRLPVGLTVTDANPRPRRIDELMFFSRGEFTTRRTPLSPDMIATSDVARIYYGHGQQMPVDFGPNPDAPDYTTRYARPRLDETMGDITVGGAPAVARLGQPSSLGVVNPNEFASDWSLLRHVTLLVPRSTGIQSLPDNVLGLQPNLDPFYYGRIADSTRQVALAPAAQSVFRGVAGMVPYEINARPDAAGEYIVQGPATAGRNIRPLNNGFLTQLGTGDGTGDESLARPLFTSGIVDIAVGSLDEIRTTITRPWQDSPTLPSILEATPRSFAPVDFSRTNSRYGFESGRAFSDSTGVERVGTATASAGSVPPYAVGTPPQAQTQQLWMLEALPSVAYDPNSTAPELTGQRVRYEDVPPRVYLDDGTDPALPEDRIRRAIEQADQEMLASSVFVPRCTEFIVEFSFGIVDRRAGTPNYGQQLWHGLRRQNGEGQIIVDEFGVQFGNRQLVDDPQLTNDPFSISGAFPASAFEDGNLPINPSAADSGSGFDALDQEMIELVRMVQRFPPSGTPLNDNIAEYCFGYTYRDWNEDEDGDGVAAGDADDVERDWPWPTMVRVTMRFVDPADLENEQSFQFEFRVPGLRGRL